METDSGSLVFAIFMFLLVAVIVTRAIKEYRAKRKTPGYSSDRRANKEIAIGMLKDLLGMTKKSDDNPMKHREGDNGALFK
jgi:hypothetical protein